jgi:RHS repeat-associated protein
LYDAWGKVKRLPVDEVEQPLRLQGQYFDEETGLACNRFRYYDSHIGSFVSQDPLGMVAGENVYTYGPNVQGWIDPLGLACTKPKSSIVLGQNMDDRVIPTAKKLNSGWLDVSPKDWTWEKNVDFLDENIAKANSGTGRIFDIGGQRGRYQGPNAIYSKEKAVLRSNGYERVSTGKWVTAENGKKFRLYEWVKK